MSESESESDNNYFSDSDKEEENIENKHQTLDELYPENEMDEETNDIINEFIKNTSMEDIESSYMNIGVEKKKKRVRERKENDKKMIEIEVNDFTVERKPEKKKWKSKRMHNKKRENGYVKKKVVRMFHPNLPSPLYLKLQNNRNNNRRNNSREIDINDNSFPNLE